MFLLCSFHACWLCSLWSCWCSCFVLSLLDPSLLFFVSYVVLFMLFLLQCSFRAASHSVISSIAPFVLFLTLPLFTLFLSRCYSSHFITLHVVAFHTIPLALPLFSHHCSSRATTPIMLLPSPYCSSHNVVPFTLSFSHHHSPCISNTY